MVLMGSFTSVAASPDQVTLVDDGATKVVNAASLLESIMIVQPVNVLADAYVVEAIAAEPVSCAASQSPLVKQCNIEKETAAERVTRQASIYFIRPPNPLLTRHIYLEGLSIRQPTGSQEKISLQPQGEG